MGTENQNQSNPVPQVGANFQILYDGICESVPADVRYKVAKNILQVCINVTPTIQALIAANEKGYVIIDEIPYPISAYAGPTFVQALLDVSLGYVDEAAKRKATPLVNVKAIPNFTCSKSDGKVLNPDEFMNEWESLATSRFKIPTIQYHKGCSVMMDYKAFILNNEVVFFNESGRLSEEAITFMNVTIPFDPKYFVSTKKLSDREVTSWIAQQFSPTSYKEVTQSIATPVQAES